MEDDELICENIKTYFELKGAEVVYFHDGESLLDSVDFGSFDIALLDINTPKKSGFDTLSEIRSSGSNIPAIFLTAQSDIEHIKKGYELGCNDYLKKPFMLDELSIRIDNILHKNIKIVKISESYKFNLSNKSILKDGVVIDLNSNQRDLLYILSKNIDLVVSKEQITSYIWSDKFVAENTLRTLIKKTREKLGENFILNIRNQGYKIESVK